MSKKLNDSRILAIETSSRVGSAAIALGDEILAAKSFTAGLRHGVELIPTIDALCKQVNFTAQDIDCLFVSAEPGYCPVACNDTALPFKCQVRGVEYVIHIFPTTIRRKPIEYHKGTSNNTLLEVKN